MGCTRRERGVEGRRLGATGLGSTTEPTMPDGKKRTNESIYLPTIGTMCTVAACNRGLVKIGPRVC